MVNRRLLRIKAFQNLYAYRQADRANYLMALDLIADSFLPNLDLMIPKEEQMPKLEGLRKLSEIYFEELFNNKDSEEEIPADSKLAAKKALKYYHDVLKRDRSQIIKQMVEEVENIYNTYLKLILLLKEINSTAVWDEQRRLLETDIKTSRLANNQVLAALSSLPALEVEAIRKDIRWDDEEQNIIRKLFRDAILPDPEFQAYLRTTKHTFEEDLKLVQYLLKTFVLKHHLIADYFEEKDLNWGENKDVLKSMTTKTFKVTEGQQLELQPLAMNWEDDKIYYVDLFNQTLDNDQAYEKIIMSQTANWEADRLASTDMIILKMALAEMINFPSIPVKVTINEFIELAKNYSTPKSGQFINGILDVLSTKLINDGIIRKSGRGLIDNK
ncbi:NusB antitermination factor [Pseudarcicella hirudinis]|uniref:NusB antitermination factor n=2 Tax=Pseudarcicella hirudinis TaxID=1079859 RepID=A0A1I5P2R0_9BACT|nr:NusB antitermination factor [Pseudarcicella hirudinis]